MKTRLLIIVPNLGFGGQERVAASTADLLGDVCETTVAVFNTEENSFTPSCPVLNLKLPPAAGKINKLLNVIKRVKAVKRLKQDLGIHVCFSFGSTANLVNSLSRRSEKVILSVRGYESLQGSGVSRAIDRMVYNRADMVIGVADKISHDLKNRFGLPEHKVATLYNPYNCDVIMQQSKQPMPLQLEHPAIVSMGRLEKVKGFSHLLQAFNRVLETMPTATLILIGEGSMRSRLEQLAIDLGISDRIIFTGYQSEPYSYLGQCDLFVMTSLHEGFPNAMVEAMACGLPVIAADCHSGPREILCQQYQPVVASGLESADYGLLIPPFKSDDSDEPEQEAMLANAIIGLLSDSRAYEHYRNKSRERAGHFSNDIYRKRILEFIRTAPERRKAYITFRMDDIHPRMKYDIFQQYRELFDRYHIKPLLGIIPDNQDESLNKGPEISNFWEMIRELKEQGWSVAQHGNTHRYQTGQKGLCSLNARSEFAGLEYQVQLDKVRRGQAILEGHGLKTGIFMAPGHSLDDNTLTALRECGFEYVTDGRSRWPYRYQGLKFIPCRDHQIRNRAGLITVCIHAHSASQTSIASLDHAISRCRDRIIDFSKALDLPESNYAWARIEELLNILYEARVKPALYPLYSRAKGLFGR